MLRILVTGASGFIGRALLARLVAEPEMRLRGSVRLMTPALPQAVEQVRVGNLGPDTAWQSIVAGMDMVVHTAARVHIAARPSRESVAEFRRANVEGTLGLARQAARAGVRRFIFLSTVKVNGESAPPGRPCRAEDAPAPADAYALSKLEAEQGLRRLSEETGMEVVTIRPPLVYGPGVRANFLRLMRWVDKGFPLPLGRVANRRSLIYVGNLVDAIAACLRHPAAAGKVFLVSDGEDISTPELICRLAAAMGRPPRLLFVPAALLKCGAMILCRMPDFGRLAESLCVDAGLLRERLDWQPPWRLQAGLEDTVAWYKSLAAT